MRIAAPYGATLGVKLRSIRAGDDVEALARELAPAFGGEKADALELLGQTIGLLRRNPRPDPWGPYLAEVGPDSVGLCAFKAAPSDKGEIEIAYMTFPAFERRGHATAMAGALARIALDARVPTVIAHTLPEENASTRALRSNGFSHAGEVIDPEDGLVWRWEKRQGGGSA